MPHSSADFTQSVPITALRSGDHGTVGLLAMCLLDNPLQDVTKEDLENCTGALATTITFYHLGLDLAEAIQMGYPGEPQQISRVLQSIGVNDPSLGPFARAMQSAWTNGLTYVSKTEWVVPCGGRVVLILFPVQISSLHLS